MDLISMIKTLKILRQLLQQSLSLELPVFKFSRCCDATPGNTSTPSLAGSRCQSQSQHPADTPVGKDRVEGEGDCRPSLEIA